MKSKSEKFQVGHRYLISFYDYPSRNNLSEVRVLELSKGNRVKFAVKCSDNTEYYKWHEIYGIFIVEDLGIATEPLDELLSGESVCKAEPEDPGELSDGYHTFNELYRYRMLYNAAFFNQIASDKNFTGFVGKSHRHSDGELCFGGGWFIVVANLPTGQISNHYEDKYWDLFKINDYPIIPIEYDGHTPNEAADRLEKYIMNGLSNEQELQPSSN